MNVAICGGFVDGTWVDTGPKFNVHNPADGALIGQVADCGDEVIENAIVAAKRSQPAWAALSAKERSEIMFAWARLILENEEDLARTITAECGKPLAEARGEVRYGASFVQWYGEEAKRVYGDVLPGDQPSKRIMVLKQPVGVVATITPWNFPVAMICRKAAPGLAVGCTVIARPSELTPLSALALARLAEEAGFPSGAFNVVTSLDAQRFGEIVCSDVRIAKVSFTGSTRVGRILFRQCGEQIKKLTLELGGNAPFIVLPSANLESAAQGLIGSKFRNAGQTCICPNRVYVHQEVHDAFVEIMRREVDALVLGNGSEPGVTVGPLINNSAVEKVEAHVADALQLGASIQTGGERAPALGEGFYRPTLLANVAPASRISNEETFGPILPIIKVVSEEEAVHLSNKSAFGLAAYLYSNDLRQVWRVCEALETGMIGVNSGVISTELAPFGGIKQSGIGREGSKYGTEDFLNLKYINLDLAG